MYKVLKQYNNKITKSQNDYINTKQNSSHINSAFLLFKNLFYDSKN